MTDEVLVIGAGVAGLSAARVLADAGLSVSVVERAAGVGGRCATRRVEGRPVDHGVGFLHGSSPEFRRAIDAVEGRALPGWPRRVQGTGPPCQARTFRSGEFRIAFAEGISSFPKILARGLRVERGRRVVALEPIPGGVRAALEGGEVRAASRTIVALAVEQTTALLETWPREATPPIASLRALLRGLGSRSALTLIAAYPDEVPVPEWDAFYPEDSPILQIVLHDASKRLELRPTILVFQARPCWSRTHLDGEGPAWESAMLAEAGRVVGRWAASPRWTQRHIWRYARVDGGCELSGPVWVPRGGGGIGFAGEAFGAGGGVEAAFLSGKRLAERMLEKETP